MSARPASPRRREDRLCMCLAAFCGGAFSVMFLLAIAGGARP